MNSYLEFNKNYYDRGYDADNVESYVFRAYGRIFKHDLGFDGSSSERVLDFGCGQGAAVRFLSSKGFDAYGVDISERDLRKARELSPEISDHFAEIDPKPGERDMFFGGGFDLIISIQTLYFLSDTDLEIRLRSLHNMLKPGGYIYASMMGTRAYFANFATPADDGMSKIDFANDRITYKDLFVNLTESSQDLEQKFHLFDKVYVGYYDRDYRNEGSEFHYTFTGRKTT